MKRKKRGSSLLVVISTFFLLFTFGTAIASATTAAYRNQISKSKRVENLYSSESGIDMTYTIIGKTIEAAILASNKAVEENFYSNGGYIEAERINLNNVGNKLLFPDGKGFSRIFKKEDSRIIINNENLEIEEEKLFKKNFQEFIKTMLPTCIEEGKYIDKFNESSLISVNIQDTDDKRQEKIYNEYGNESEFKEVEYENDIKPKFEVIVDLDSESYMEKDNKKVYKFPIIISSEFYTGIENDKSATNIEQIKPGTQQRVLTVKYEVTVPKYNSGTTTKKVQILKMPVFQHSFAAQGNATLAGDIYVDGNIYVKGKDGIESTDYNNKVVFDKYNNGITIETLGGSSTNTTVDIEGDIVTTKNISLRDYTNLNMKGDLYASNFHLGKYRDDITSSVNGTSTNIGVNVNDNGNLNLYLSNDLSIYADNSKVNIGEFYGLNDITEDNKSMTLNNSSIKEANRSSSILINSTKDVELNIYKDAYISGTAYINTESKYQTGESIAIKGNYQAYANSLEGQFIGGSTTEKYEDVKFIYDRPLQLVSEINGNAKLNVFDKAKYFEDYAKNNKDKLNNSVIVNLHKNTYSVGAYVNGNEIKGTTGNIVESLVKKVSEEQKLFAKKVYGFGEVDRDFYEPENIRTISDELDFSKLPQVVGRVSDYGYDVIFNNNPNKKVVLIGNGADSFYNSIKGDSNIIVYDCRNRHNATGGFEGLILSAGDVEIYGDIEIRGSIITGKDLIANKDDSIKKFIYDEIVINRVIAIYYDNLYDNNNGAIINPSHNNTEEVEVKWNNSKQHNVKNYIKQGLWTIKK